MFPEKAYQPLFIPASGFLLSAIFPIIAPAGSTTLA
jgi:hypothetical protein